MTDLPLKFHSLHHLLLEALVIRFFQTRAVLISFFLWSSLFSGWSESFFPDQATSITILDPETGQIIYQENPKTPLPPASTTKLFSSLALAEQLDPQTTFKTELFVTKTSKPHHAYLILTTVGDPSFTTSDLQHMLSALGPLKISVIDSITLITPETEGPNVPLGLTQDSLPMCYATPIDPFIIDHNCFTVTLDGQKKASQSKDSAIPIHIDDQLRWIAEDHHDCIFEPALHDQTLTLKGCFSGLDRSTLKFALPLTEARLITLFNRQLKALNIAWKGKLSITSTRPTHLGKPLLTHASAPLQDLMKYTLQTSDNLYAEFFLRQLALQAKHPSSFKWGLKALSAQLNMPDLALEDGSGDSHYNLVSSEQLAKLLTRAYHQRDFFPLWLSFLPQAGKTGSLQSFFKNTSLEGKLFAKTGSLIRIHTLAGYFEHHPQHYWVVVIMTFGTDAKSDFYRNVQRLLETR